MGGTLIDINSPGNNVNNELTLIAFIQIVSIQCIRKGIDEKGIN